jgi:hypothetical protein
MANGFVRGLLLIVLGLGVAGFGICSLCGGVMGVVTFAEGKQSSRDIARLAFGMSAAGVVLAWLCWIGIRALRKKPIADASQVLPPGAQ